ncbi:MAG: AraC family transcriptional regulator [Chitinophagaceae bacterium]|nr:AraC family transcriptional regulator [Chitinophagaceae bacterium]
MKTNPIPPPQLYMLPRNVQDVVIAQSPSYAYGRQALLWVRVFIFIEKPSSFSIDFSTQKVSTKALYIVPKTHFHFISPSKKCKFWCIDIPFEKLSEQDADLLFLLKFRHQKQIPLSVELSIELNKFLQNKSSNAALVIPLLQQAISASLTQNHFDEACFQYHLPMAKNLLDLLWKRDEKLEHLAIGKIALELCCSPKTLSRTCKAVFGQTVQNVLQYQILLASLFMMHHCQDIAAIARELGFADKKSFIKFIKRKVNHTPKQIIDLIHGNTIASTK